MTVPAVISDVTHAALLALAPHGLQGRARANARAAMLADAAHAQLRAEAAEAWGDAQQVLDLRTAAVPAAS